MREIQSFLALNAGDLSAFVLTLHLPYLTPTEMETIGGDSGLWQPYADWFSSVLGMLSGPRAFDGYLEFGFDRNVQFLTRWIDLHQRADLTDDERELATTYWDGSRDIAQKICKIKEKVAEKKTDDKIIMKCSGLIMKKEHIDFLKFWFTDRDSFSYQRQTYGSKSELQFIAM